MGVLKAVKGALLRYRRLLIWAVLVSYGIWLCLALPLAGGLWAEELGISGSVNTGYWITPSLTPTPETGLTPSLTPTCLPCRGTSLEAEKTAEGFVEERQGVIVYGVRGMVCVTNSGERPTENLQIVDVVQAKQQRQHFVNLHSAEVNLSEKPQLQPGETYCYAYEITFEPLEGDMVHYRNLALVTITNHSGWLPGSRNCPGPHPCPFGPKPKTGFELPSPPQIPEPGPGQANPLPTQTPAPSFTPSPMLDENTTPTFTSTPQPTIPPEALETPQPSPTLPPTQSETPPPSPTDTPEPPLPVAPTDTPEPPLPVPPTDTPPPPVI